MILPATDWLSGAFNYSLQLVLQLLGCLAASLLIYVIYVSYCLLRRYLRIRFGKRVQPDGTKAVIITGATSGFGLAIAKRLYKRGFTVFACYYNDQEAGYAELMDLQKSSKHQDGGNLEEEKDKLSSSDKSSMFLIRMDVRSSESIAESGAEVKRLLDSHGLKLHCLLNNAGICSDGPFELLTSESVRNMVATNVAGVFHVTKVFISRIIRDRGKVVNVSSGIHMIPCQSMSLYGSSKAALSYFSDALHQDLRPYGAGCFTIYPGNLSLQTNIAFTRIASLQSAIGQLSEEEKAAYRTKIDAHTKALNYFLKVRMASCPHEDPKRLAELFNIELPDFGNKNSRESPRPRRRRNLITSLQRLAFRFLLIFAGGSRGDIDLDRNGSTDCFESTIALDEPPRRTYAGSKIYQFLSGPIVDYLPVSLMMGTVNSLINSAQ